MKKEFRIRKREFFLRAACSRNFFRTDFFVIQCCKNELDQFRVGFTASKKVGGAVQRNRCKRRMRAAADQLLKLQGQSGVDYVFIAKKKQIDVPWEQLLQGFRDGLRFVNKKISI